MRNHDVASGGFAELRTRVGVDTGRPRVLRPATGREIFREIQPAGASYACPLPCDGGQSWGTAACDIK